MIALVRKTAPKRLCRSTTRASVGVEEYDLSETLSRARSNLTLKNKPWSKNTWPFNGPTAPTHLHTPTAFIHEEKCPQSYYLFFWRISQPQPDWNSPNPLIMQNFGQIREYTELPMVLLPLAQGEVDEAFCNLAPRIKLNGAAGTRFFSSLWGSKDLQGYTFQDYVHLKKLDFILLILGAYIHLWFWINVSPFREAFPYYMFSLCLSDPFLQPSQLSMTSVHAVFFIHRGLHNPSTSSIMFARIACFKRRARKRHWRLG